MFATKSLVASLLFAAAAFSVNAGATVINFDHLAGTAIAGSPYVSPGRYTQLPALTTIGGMTFAATYSSYLIGPGYSGSDAASYAFNGTDYLMTYGAITIRSATASPFSVNSLDLVSWSDITYANTATLTGQRQGGGVVTQSLNLSSVRNSMKHVGNDFTTFALTGFDNLTALTVTHSGNTSIAMDNLTINEANVPEPSVLALLGVALAGCVFARRRA